MKLDHPPIRTYVTREAATARSIAASIETLRYSILPMLIAHEVPAVPRCQRLSVTTPVVIREVIGRQQALVTSLYSSAKQDSHTKGTLRTARLVRGVRPTRAVESWQETARTFLATLLPFSITLVRITSVSVSETDSSPQLRDVGTSRDKNFRVIVIGTTGRAEHGSTARSSLCSVLACGSTILLTSRSAGSVRDGMSDCVDFTLKMERTQDVRSVDSPTYKTRVARAPVMYINFSIAVGEGEQAFQASVGKRTGYDDGVTVGVSKP